MNCLRINPNSLLRATLAGLLASCSASAVHAANCGAAALGGGSSGPPSISATEASTTQVLEEIRRRTQVAQQEAQTTPVSYTTAAGGTQPPAGGSASSQAAKAVAEPAPAGTSTAGKAKVTKMAAAETREGTYETRAQLAGGDRITSSWGQGFLDYEHHDNIAPGQQENRDRNSRNAGVMSGTDWTWVQPSASQAIQVGVFSGYSATFNTFGNTKFTVDTGDGNGTDNFTRTDSKQDISGSFYGAYLAAVRGNATFGLAFKADVFDLDQSSLLTQTNGTCGPGNIPTAFEVGSASVNNYTITGEASYRHFVGPGRWLEPALGFRFTATQYGSDPTSLLSTGGSGVTILQNASSGQLGLEDGTVFRIIGGLRAGQETALPDGGIWTLMGGAFIYSDVSITGFKFTPTTTDSGGNPLPTTSGTTVFPIDEGKVRGLGQIISTVDYADGWSYLLAGEIRGGEDLFGVGGRVGARYQW